MKILHKDGDEFNILAFPKEEFSLGDYMLIEDLKKHRGLILQVIEAKYANIPGILEEILRDGLVNGIESNDIDPFDIQSQIAVLKDVKLLICKVRGTKRGESLLPYGNFVPSRNYYTIKQLSSNNLVSLKNQSRPIELGKTSKDRQLFMDALSFDGRLNLITGRKGTGKSHLSKLLLLGIIDQGAPCLVLDINGEYINLTYDKEGKKHDKYHNKISILTPGKNFKISLKELGLHPLLNMLTYALDLPRNSTRVFIRIWRKLQKEKMCLEEMIELVNHWKCNESIREAILSRLYTMIDSGIFSDDFTCLSNLLKLIHSMEQGGAIIVNLKDKSAITRRMVVELLLGLLKTLLSKREILPLFLFAEEAHLYLRETYWDDIVTRMRHLGLFTTFITNQPDSINESIYRQLDNIFLFNFQNDKDLEAISKTTKIDSDSIKVIVKNLPPKHCFILGDAANNFPIIAKVKQLEVKAMGETRLFFKKSVLRSIT